MSGCPANAPPAGRHGEVHPDAAGSEAAHQDLPESPASPPLWLSEEEETQGGRDSHDEEEVPACGQLERKWLLWHDFMKEQSHLEAWLHTAEQAVSGARLGNLPYLTAKEELRKFERLLCDARCRLIQLDNLTHRNRTLTRLFGGTLRSRLRASVRGCGQRWDEVNTRLENITAHLKCFVSEWEEFEAEREELELLLADLDVRLTEVEHLAEDTCEKLKQLQSFQQCVCTNSERVNALLQRGESLIQRCHANDAQHLETQLMELLQRCSLVHNNIASAHTRLLSMRLVFEDDWILSQAPDSGCPSESLLEEELVLDRAHPDLLPAPNHPKDNHRSCDKPRPLAPPPLTSSTHEHLGLEWDPSVDIGRSVSPYDGDSSYFSANTGGVPRDDVRSHSFLSSLSDVAGEGHEADLASDSWLDQNRHMVQPVETQWAGADQPAASTPSQWDDSWPVRFDGGRVRAWLGVQNPEGRSCCSRAVQTEGVCLDDSQVNRSSSQQCLDEAHQPQLGHTASQSHDQGSPREAMKKHSGWNLQAEGGTSSYKETEKLLSSEQSGTSSSRSSSPRLLCLLLAAVALLAGLVLLGLVRFGLEQPCHRSNRMRRSFHLMLTYVNGPPPT